MASGKVKKSKSAAADHAAKKKSDLVQDNVPEDTFEHVEQTSPSLNPHISPLSKGQLQNDIFECISEHNKLKKVVKGINQTQKLVQRSQASLVVIAADVEPIELTMSLPNLCEEAGVPYVFVNSMENLGRNTGLKTKVSACGLKSDENISLKNVVHRVKLGIDKINL